MKLVTSYIALIVSVFLVSCGDTEAHFIPTPDVEEPEKSSNFVRLALDISPLPASTRSSIGIKDGYFFLVSKNEEGEMKLVERVYFDQDDLDPEWTTQGNVTIRYLKISINANPGKYLALVLANPTNEIKKTIESSETPWLETAEFSESHMTKPNGLEKVMTNIIPIGKAWTQENLYPIIEVGAKEEGVIIPIGRVLSKISIKNNYSSIQPLNYPKTIEIRPNKNEVSTYPLVPVIGFQVRGLGLVNIPKEIYLWPNFFSVSNNKQFPISPHKGEYLSISNAKLKWNKILGDYVYYQNNNTTIGGTHKYIGSNFDVEFYLPENIGTIYNESTFKYVAPRGCVTAVIIRLGTGGEVNFVSFRKKTSWGYENKIGLIHTNGATGYNSFLKREGYELWNKYDGFMYYYLYINDPNHKAFINGRNQTFPSVFRNTNYIVNMPNIHKVGTSIPGTNLEKGVDRAYDALRESEQMLSSRNGYIDDSIITTE